MIKIHNFFNKKKFFIILPPPNITGELHIGHFFQYFIFDIIIKWKILQEYKINFFFGFDHAGISSIIKFKKIKNIINQKKKIIENFFKQIKYIKFFICLKKSEFTLNKKFKNIVIKNFLILYKNKKIILYKKMLNFNNKIGIVSDSEIVKKIYIKYLYYIKYKIKNTFLIISTSNITSLFYNNFIVLNFKTLFKKIKSPLKTLIKIYNTNKKILNFSKIIKLSFNNNNYDYIFFLKKKKIFNIKIFFLKFKKIKKTFFFNYIYKNNYLLCAKKYISFNYIYNNNIIKTKLFIQWFFKIKKFINYKKIFIKIKIIPEKYKKIFFSWIKNISNWCISRQIKWGVRLPMIYDIENYIYIKYFLRFVKYYKIKDVFDTWFNSSFWIIFSYLKFKKTHNIVISGFDIIFYWIIKMIINNIFFQKKKLIKIILIHGIIKDKYNKKISKTTNNVINFIHIKKNIYKIKKYLTKNIFNDNYLLNNVILKKKNIILKTSNTLDIIYDIYNFYFFKKKYIINLKKNIFTFNKSKIKLKKNIFSKKIYITLLKIFFPDKQILNSNWNFTFNFYIHKFNKKYFCIIKINKKIFFIKKKYLIYFEIFFNIKVLFYVKYKN